MADVIGPIYHNFDLGFDTEDIKRIEIKQDSDRTHILVITIYTNDDVMVLNPAWDYHITMRKPDGKLIVDTENIEVENNKIYVTCTAQMLSAPGTSKCELVIFNNSQSVYTNNFYIYVDEDLIDGDDVESTDEFNSLVRVLRLIQEYEILARQSKENAATSESQAATSATNAADYEIQIRDILDSLEGYEDLIAQLIAQIETTASEVDILKQRVQDGVDDVENLLRRLEALGIDRLQDIINNALTIYDNLQTLNNDCTAIAGSISDAADSVQIMVADIEDKLDRVNSKYLIFEQQFDDLSDKMAEIQDFLDNMDAMKRQMEQDRDDIAATKEQANRDAVAILEMRDEIENLLEEIRREAEEGAGGFDPIIISPTEPDPDVQTKDDEWLQPYE